MPFYVFVMGSYDCVFVGPFESEQAAQAHADLIPDNFDASPITESDMLANIAEFGAVEILTIADSLRSIAMDSRNSGAD